MKAFRGSLVAVVLLGLVAALVMRLKPAVLESVPCVLPANSTATFFKREYNDSRFVPFAAPAPPWTSFAKT